MPIKRLTEEQIRSIPSLRPTMTLGQIAIQLGTTRQTVSKWIAVHEKALGQELPRPPRQSIASRILQGTKTMPKQE